MTQQPVTLRQIVTNRALRDSIEWLLPGWTYSRPLILAMRIKGRALQLDLNSTRAQRGTFGQVARMQVVERKEAGSVITRVMASVGAVDRVVMAFQVGEIGAKRVGPELAAVESGSVLRLEGDGASTEWTGGYSDSGGDYSESDGDLSSEGDSTSESGTSGLDWDSDDDASWEWGVSSSSESGSAIW